MDTYFGFTRIVIARLSRALLIAFVGLFVGCSPQEEPAPAQSPGESTPRGVAGDGPVKPHAIFELTIEGLAPTTSGDSLRLSGEVFTPDGADLEAIKKILSAELEDEAVSITWRETADSVRFGFILSAMTQTDQPQELRISWDGTAIGSDQVGQRNVTLPARDTFTVTGARVVREGQMYVEVSFSQPLDPNQNLGGLVQLGGAEVRTRVDGSRLRLFPREQLDGQVLLQVSDLLRSSRGRRLSESHEQELRLTLISPGVRFLSSSSILPPARQISVPFEAASVDSVQVTAFKVFEGNIGQHLQHNSLTDARLDDRTGRYLWRKTYTLPEPATDGWERFNLDLTELMAAHPEGLVQLVLRVDRSNSLYPCDGPRPDRPEDPAPESHEGDWSHQGAAHPSWYRAYYESRGYWVYSERNNPCHESYYRYSNQVSARRSFQVSNLGLLAKLGGDRQVEVVVTRLLDTEPMPDTRIRVYNFQQQRIGEGRTDAYGMASIRADGQPFYLVAEHDDSRGYLRLARNEALPTNQFDVQGEPVRDGLKGFIYGERDVWRPGDDIHLTFILEDQDGLWPEDHPVSLDLFDPQGRKVDSQLARESVNGFYRFTLRTEDTAPTGNWRAVVHLGNRYFDKLLKIETIMPNRLRLDLAFEETPLRLDAMPAQAELSAQWLHGATAAHLRADTEVRLQPKATRFEGYSQFTFDDPAREFASATQPLFEGSLDADGKVTFPVNLPLASPPPGQLSAVFINRVFEPGGAFSTGLRRFDYLPFEQWVGVHVPEGRGYHGAIARDQDHQVTFQSLSSGGTPLADRELDVTLYKVDWRWWWDRGRDNLASFVATESRAPVADQRVQTDAQGRAQWLLAKDQYEWGRYLLRVCDAEGGHCAGELVYLGWSSRESVNPASATQLMLSTDKERYAVGDTASVRLPELASGRVLLSLENGRRVLERRWVDLAPGQTELSIPVTTAMTPNVYVHVALLLPHQQRTSDAPMRLYGVVPLRVEDPATRLTPELDAPEEVRPESRFDVHVNEASGRPMTYTLALVDEGLLGITGYRTPDPHGHFYRREALGVHTWDLFDQVVGAYGASLQRVLAIGGSDADDEADANPRERRFPPVVKFLGPFTLDAGQTQTHTLELPPYLGEVRLMLVAGDQGAYGKAERPVTVTQPLSLLATLPRVVGPGETIALPVQVFATDETIDSVTLDTRTSDLFVLEQGEAELAMDGRQEAIAQLRLRVKDQVGFGEVTVTARSGDETASQTLTIESRAPNPPSVRREQVLLAPGEQWQSSLEAHGLAGTNDASVEVSRLPSLNLEQRLGYLLNYPHGCLEQVTSGAFPQLYLDRLVTLSDAQMQERDVNLQAAIERLSRLQLSSGAFSYWPGERYANEWASLYAGHFLTEARRSGHGVSPEVLSRWLSHERQLARQFGGEGYRQQVQAYRLYVLALAGEAETPAMNRLREQLRQDDDERSSTARRLLASAYFHLGLSDAGRALMPADGQVPMYDDPGYTYGSALRDRAIDLLVQVQAGNTEKAWDQAERVARALSDNDWLSTQSVAWSLVALSTFAGELDADQPMRFALDTDGDWQDVESLNHWYRQRLISTQVAVRNDSEQNLRVLLSNRGTPAAAQEQAEAEGLDLQVRFASLAGDPLSVNELPQGTDFVAEVSVSADFAAIGRARLEDIALSLVMPSGWQIRNERLEGGDAPEGFDYLDIRDDRVLGYFSLWRDHVWQWRYDDERQERVTLRVLLNASYAGEFYLPGWRAEAMYDERINAGTAGQWVRVVQGD
ncbi:alpha-2-macroglobulin family protein [Marinimicrobium alkaliphilum]|uniref:alpha-2-macroglobulin family protein n=1 Tax=Marinimicrobium alkaliphilum TaxID=2202654 RepID=UPI000DB95278|nr:MG2 domain-containing protein [Marinimicrobium alkaliphilum]